MALRQDVLMREQLSPDDVTRLHHAVRDDLAVQHPISQREVDEGFFDVLADMLVARIDAGFGRVLS
jgi:hypothetical protein